MHAGGFVTGTERRVAADPAMDDRAVIRYEDRFLLAHMPEPWRAALAARGLPLPQRDRAARAWVWPDEDAAAVQYLHEAHDVPLDDKAAERLPTVDDRARVRAVEAKLRGYQRKGVAFLADRRRAFLADGMGLGKTVQALLALERLSAFPAGVLCPASTKLGWQAEVVRWVPWRSVQVLQSGSDPLEDVDLVVLNPELLPRKLEELLLWGPQAVVLDEAHQYKNPAAQRSQLAEELVQDVPVRFALSGTPIPNRRPDLLQQLRLLGQLEEVLGIYRGVLPHYWKPPEPLPHEHAMRALEKLPRQEVHQRLRQTCFLRRTKDEVHQELPPFHRTRRDLLLPDASPYKQHELDFIAWVRAQRQAEQETRETVNGTARTRGEPAPHPGDPHGDAPTPRPDARHGDAPAPRPDGPGSDEQAPHAASTVSTGWSATTRLRGRQHLSVLRREAALAKIPAVVEWAEGLEGERVVYFSHHRQVAHALADALPGKHAVLTGELPAPERQGIIDRLADYDGIVATMDASGQGVDGMQLHARHVVFVELDWTPTKHEQCEGRLHRIGQRDRVEAWYFIGRDTIDEAMMRRLDEKWRDVQGVLAGDEATDHFVAAVMDRAAKGAHLWHGL